MQKNLAPELYSSRHTWATFRRCNLPNLVSAISVNFSHFPVMLILVLVLVGLVLVLVLAGPVLDKSYSLI